jgi:hypothetical protein
VAAIFSATVAYNSNRSAGILPADLRIFRRKTPPSAGKMSLCENSEKRRVSTQFPTTYENLSTTYASSLEFSHKLKMPALQRCSSQYRSGITTANLDPESIQAR